MQVEIVSGWQNMKEKMYELSTFNLIVANVTLKIMKHLDIFLLILAPPPPPST